MCCDASLWLLTTFEYILSFCTMCLFICFPVSYESDVILHPHPCIYSILLWQRVLRGPKVSTHQKISLFLTTQCRPARRHRDHSERCWDGSRVVMQVSHRNNCVEAREAAEDEERGRCPKKNKIRNWCRIEVTRGVARRLPSCVGWFILEM